MLILKLGDGFAGLNSSLAVSFKSSTSLSSPNLELPSSSIEKPSVVVKQASTTSMVLTKLRLLRRGSPCTRWSRRPAGLLSCLRLNLSFFVCLCFRVSVMLLSSLSWRLLPLFTVSASLKRSLASLPPARADREAEQWGFDTQHMALAFVP